MQELDQSELPVSNGYHKIGAITQILDKFSLYITHLENVATDTSYRAKEHNQIKGYLNKWKNSKMLVNLCFYL